MDGEKASGERIRALPELQGRRVYLVHNPGIGADTDSGGMPRDHAEAPGLAAAGADEQFVRRRVQFATGDEYSRGQGLYVQPAKQHESASGNMDIFQFRRRCGMMWWPRR